MKGSLVSNKNMTKNCTNEQRNKNREHAES